MKASDYIAEFFYQQQIPFVFELSGGMITHILDSLCRLGKTPVISMHHEQAAAFAAEGVARMTGKSAVALATSGPGATNLLTAIGSCYFDSVPALFITGQVNRNEMKGSRSVRQLGFQETDIVSMAAPITKAAWLADNPTELTRVLNDAYRLAVSGRPGPVLVDIPMDVQRTEISPAPVLPDADDTEDAAGIDPGITAQLIDRMKSAERPLILAGGGIRTAGAVTAFRRCVQYSGIPVVHSMMGVDVLPTGTPHRVGLIGTYGNRWANMAVASSDLLLVLGSRLDIRQTGADVQAFHGDRTIIHVDCDPSEINNRVDGCIPIIAHLQPFTEALAKGLAASTLPDWSGWLHAISELRARYPDTGELAHIQGINPNVFMHSLSQASGMAAAFVTDVGQNQVWASQSLEILEDQRLLTSGGMGSMGFALPAAIGATLACARRPVVVIAGDGGLQCNIQELQTIVRNHLPIKIVVLNNGCHGMVRQFQQMYFEGRFQSTQWGYSAPDFARVAEAYGIPGRTISDMGTSASALEWLWKEPYEPALLQVMLDAYTDVCPKMVFGKPLTEMSPAI